MNATDTHTNDNQTGTRPLDGRTAVVTGATSGIGAATARRLGADGAAVALLGRRADRLEALAADLADTDAPGVVPVATDIRDAEAMAVAADTVRSELGRVDLVVANAGVMLAAPFEEADPDEWQRMLDTNIAGLLRTDRAFVDDLIAAADDGGQADLIHVGSIGGHERFANFAVYGATKAAVAHLTRNLRTELGPRNVRVKNVEPGLVHTELGDHISSAGDRKMVREWRDSIEALNADDIAAAIAFAAAMPRHVNVAELIVVPTQQG